MGQFLFHAKEQPKIYFLQIGIFEIRPQQLFIDLQYRWGGVQKRANIWTLFDVIIQDIFVWIERILIPFMENLLPKINKNKKMQLYVFTYDPSKSTQHLVAKFIEPNNLVYVGRAQKLKVQPWHR
jgi:hypothetical protein